MKAYGKTLENPKKSMIKKTERTRIRNRPAFLNNNKSKNYSAKEAETKTAGGIIIPDSVKEKPLQGEVIAVGGAKKDEIVEVKVGDNVLYGKYAGTEINLNGVDYLLLNQSDIQIGRAHV